MDRMTERRDPSKERQEKEAALAAALRANLRRRKRDAGKSTLPEVARGKDEDEP